MQTQPEKNSNIMREARSSRMLPGMAGQAASANRVVCEAGTWAKGEQQQNSDTLKPAHQSITVIKLSFTGAVITPSFGFTDMC